MNLTLYEYFIIMIPFIIFQFCLDYLSDPEITHSETKIGMYQLFHQLTATIWVWTFFLPFMSSRLSVLCVCILTSIVVQIGNLVNKDYCWVTRNVNKIINPDKPNRKWVGGTIDSLMKKYTRGPEWAHSEIRTQPDNKLTTILVNSVHLILLIKIIIKQ